MRRAGPYRGENPGPGEDVEGELEPRPGIRERPGSCLVVPLTPGGGALSDVKLKKQDQELTLGFEGRVAPGKQPYSAAASDDGA